MSSTLSLQFFERQFQRQAMGPPVELNPFERAVLPWLRGRVLDHGCGMGALSLALAERGCTVLAQDGSATAVHHLQAQAAARGLHGLSVRQADLRQHHIAEMFDAVVCIGLLMFFDRPTALRQLRDLQDHVQPGGVAAVNVLIEGTTYLDMFDPVEHCLMAVGELARHFEGWELLLDQDQSFDAPGQRIKRFSTVVARKPG